MSGVFYHSVIHGLGFFINFALKYRVYAQKTIKHAFFSMFYTLIKHGFSSNQSARWVLYILKVYIYTLFLTGYIFVL